MQQFLETWLRLEPVMTVDIGEAMGNRRAFGLLTNDSFLVAVARRVHCEAIAAADSAFGTIKGFLVCGPSDLEG
jgi:predicted nucleic acid-binding protein